MQSVPSHYYGGRGRVVHMKMCMALISAGIPVDVLCSGDQVKIMDTILHCYWDDLLHFFLFKSTDSRLSNVRVQGDKHTLGGKVDLSTEEFPFYTEFKDFCSHKVACHIMKAYIYKTAMLYSETQYNKKRFSQHKSRKFQEMASPMKFIESLLSKVSL